MLKKLIRMIAFNHLRPRQCCGQGAAPGEELRYRIAGRAAYFFNESQPDAPQEGTA
jgi:hypothetical protein